MTHGSTSTHGHGGMRKSIRRWHGHLILRYEFPQFGLMRGHLQTKCRRLQVHVDRYKHGVYSHLIGDPFLKSIITKDSASTRFHACERFNRCEHVRVNGRESHTPTGHHVVYVNPVNMGTTAWEQYLKQTKEQLLRGDNVNVLVSTA